MHDVGVVTVDVVMMMVVSFRVVGVGMIVGVSSVFVRVIVKFRSMRVIVLFVEMVCMVMLAVEVLIVMVVALCAVTVL